MSGDWSSDVCSSDLPYRRFKAANLSLRRALDEVSQGPMDKPSFLLFVRADLPDGPPKPWPGRAPEVDGEGSPKPLAVRAFTVQNGRAWSCVTHRAATTDRAEIGRIRRLLAHVDCSAWCACQEYSP